MLVGARVWSSGVLERGGSDEKLRPAWQQEWDADASELTPRGATSPPSLRDGHSQTTYTAWSPAGLSRYCTTLNAAKTLLATPPPARLPSGVRCALAHAIATRTRQLDSATRTTKTGYDGLQLTADSHRLAFILYSPRSPRGEGESPSPTTAGFPTWRALPPPGLDTAGSA